MAAQACSGSSRLLPSLAQARTLSCCRHHSFSSIFLDAFLERRARAGRIRAWEGVFMENAMRSHSVPEDAVLCGAQIFPGVSDPLQPLTLLLPTCVGCWGSLGGVSYAGGFAPGWGCSPEPPTTLQTRGEVLGIIE